MNEGNSHTVRLPKEMMPRMNELEKAIRRFCDADRRHDVKPEHTVYFCTMSGWQNTLQELADEDGNGPADAVVMAMSNFVSAACSMIPDEIYTEAVAYVLSAMISRDQQRMTRAIALFLQDVDVPEGPVQ